MKLKKIAFFIGILISTNFASNAVTIKESIKLNHNVPEEYTVVEGDTLWSISEKFFHYPWLWAEIWKDNKIENPNIIYPGDKIHLIKKIDGTSDLNIERISESSKKIVVLTPNKVFSKDLNPLYAINFEKLEKIINKVKIIKENDFYNLPKIIASENENLMINKGEIVYVKGIIDKAPIGFTDSIYKISSPLFDIDNKYKGNQAIKIGEIELLAVDKELDLSKYIITAQHGRITVNDRIIREKDFNKKSLKLSIPKEDLKINILDIVGGVQYGGSFDTLILNKGSDYGLKEGNILILNKSGATINDDDSSKKIKLPNKEYGKLIVFDVQKETSLGIIYKATENVSISDIVSSPKIGF